ncbi:MAG TPA: NUDIX domain-containing protein [Chloroflexota bacterium]|nr:NUDIX domain-containing protein [Chloroflexota bacterium]
MIWLIQGLAAFVFRVAGVAVPGQVVLLQRFEEHDCWCLPGGRVEMLEPAAEASRREMQEETGCSVGVERLVWVVENFFTFEGREQHEVGLHFLMSLEPFAHLVRWAEFYGWESETPIVFRWVSLPDLRQLDLYHTFLRTTLIELPQEPKHVVHRDASFVTRPDPSRENVRPGEA